jgi:hypothetical protein
VATKEGRRRSPRRASAAARAASLSGKLVFGSLTLVRPR